MIVAPIQFENEPVRQITRLGKIKATVRSNVVKVNLLGLRGSVCSHKPSLSEFFARHSAYTNGNEVLWCQSTKKLLLIL